MKQITIVLILFLSTPLFCFGQKEQLEIGNDFKNYDGVLKEYYDNVFPLLYSRFTEKPYARYASIPSFSPEYAFSVEKIENISYIISNRLSENYWYSKKRDKVKVISKKTVIHNTLYLKIGELFQLLSKQTKKSEQGLTGLDGVTYYFSTVDKSGNIKIGETWSPKENSSLDNLVKICDKLNSIENEKSGSLKEIEQEIEKLIIDLQKSSN